MTAKGGPIVQGSATVLIGDAGGKACSVCPGGMAVGSPVNPALGAKVLMGAEDLDFALPGPLPVVWQRQYSSYVNAEFGAVCGLLGYGWKLGFEIGVRLEDERSLFFDAAGRVITFPEPLQPGQALRSAGEDLWLMRGGGLGAAETVAALAGTPGSARSNTTPGTTPDTTTSNTPEELLPWARQARWAQVPAKAKADPAFVLLASGNERMVWVTTQTQAGHSLALRYDVAGRLTELVNENQAVTRFAYDVQDRLVQEVGFDGRSQTYAYDAVGRLIDKTDSHDSGMAASSQGQGAVRSRYHYDDAGRLVARLMVKEGGKHAEPLEVHRFSYDDSGELVLAQSWSAPLVQEEALQRWLQLSGRELQTLLDNPRDESVAELAAQLQVHRLQAGSRVALQRDKLGRTTGETQTLYRWGSPGTPKPPSGEPHVEFEHHITHRLGALGHRQGTRLQGMGQLDWLSYGSGHVHGLLLNQTPLIHLERDSLHHEVGRTLQVLMEQDNGQGRNETPSVESTRELDPLGRLLQQRWRGLAVGPRNPRDATGASSQPLVGGVQGHHPSLSRLALRRYSYDGLGQLIGVQTPGDATLYEYDAQQRLIGRTHADSQGERHQRWRLDAAGNRLPEPSHLSQPGQKADWHTQVRHNLHNPEFNLLKPENDGQSASGEVQRWKDNRVTHGTDPQGRTTAYRYDAHGNRIQATSADGRKTLMHHDALHQLSRVEQFSKDGQLQNTTTYRYDAFGRRLSKTHQGIEQETPQTDYFGWDGDRLVHTEDAILIRHTVYEPGSFVPLLQLQQAKGHKTEAQTMWSLGSEDGGEDSQDGAARLFENLPRMQREMLQEALRMAMQSNSEALQGLPVNAETAQLLIESVATLKAAHDASAKAHPVTIRHYLTDHLGTPIALVDANGDRAGQVTWAASYNAWGDIEHEFNPLNLYQHIRFQGQQFDRETGLHYNRFRYYDPGIGRYITQDPIKFEGGNNFYSYPLNPTEWIDPLGLKPLTKDCCEKFKKLIEHDDKQSSALGTTCSAKYNSLSFSDDILGLNCDFESKGGPVDVDWMLRSSMGSLGAFPGMANTTYHVAKGLWNVMNGSWPNAGMDSPGHQNAPAAAFHWMISGESLRSIFDPAIQQCAAMGVKI